MVKMASFMLHMLQFFKKKSMLFPLSWLHVDLITLSIISLAFNHDFSSNIPGYILLSAGYLIF